MVRFIIVLTELTVNNIFFQHGLTPLHMSCQGNHQSTSGLLIDSKAPVNAVATVRTHDQ